MTKWLGSKYLCKKQKSSGEVLTETDVDQGDLDWLCDPDAPQNRGQVAATRQDVREILLFVDQHNPSPAH
jgi:hypothetical protein